MVYRLTGDVPGAARAQQEALQISRSLGDPLGEASALNELGVPSRLADDLPSAAKSLRRALGMAEKLGHRQSIAEVLNNLGALYRESGHRWQARACHRSALALAHAVRSPLEQASALEGTAQCAPAAGTTASATTGLSQALKIYQRVGAFEAAGLAAELAAC